MIFLCKVCCVATEAEQHPLGFWPLFLCVCGSGYQESMAAEGALGHRDYGWRMVM